VGYFAGVRFAALIVLGLLVTACGSGGERKNRLRPPPPVTMTAAIHDDIVQVSPPAVGAGQIVLIVSNQSGRPQKVTFETDELGGPAGGRRASSPVIPASGVGRLTITARQGVYSVHVGDSSVRAARVRVGPPRRSGQDDLLLP
jgi:hypothetical protein